MANGDQLMVGQSNSSNLLQYVRQGCFMDDEWVFTSEQASEQIQSCSPIFRFPGQMALIAVLSGREEQYIVGQALVIRIRLEKTPRTFCWTALGRL
jgi:hypothetical protein